MAFIVLALAAGCAESAGGPGGSQLSVESAGTGSGSAGMSAGSGAGSGSAGTGGATSATAGASGRSNTPPINENPPNPLPMAGRAGGGGGPQPTAGAGGSTPPPRTPGMGTCLQGTGDFMSDGPYQMAMKDVTLDGGLGAYTIFYPSNLESDCKHPIVAWGNGTSVSGSGTYAAYHRHAASWGIVTIASHNSNAGSMKFLEGGLDYLIAQNADSSSPFFGKLSDRAGVGGHSQGGFAATTATAHANVQAEVCVQGGGFGVPARVAFLCQTGVDDFVRSQCTSTYRAAAGPSFLLDHMMADHISTPTFGLTTSDAGRQYVRTSTAWYRCWLADDTAACAIFAGSSMAPVCSASDWATCESRNFP